MAIVTDGTHRGTSYRVEADASGTFTASWLCPGFAGEKPYWALAGHGYQFAAADDAVLACREAIDGWARQTADETPTHTAALHAATGLGVKGPGGTYKPDAQPAPGGKCARCGKPGMWIAGAGEVLCVRHQDDY